MLKRTSVAAWAIALSIPTLALSADVDTTALNRAQVVTSLVEILQGAPTSCDAVPDLPRGFGTPLACIATGSGWGKVKKAVRKIERSVASWGSMSTRGGIRGAYRVRFALVADGPTAILYEAETGVVVVVAGHPCWDAARLDALGLRDYGSPEMLTKPATVSRTRPEFPEEARRQRTGGSVLLHALIETDGTVDAVCSVFTSSPGLGFEEAAIEAVRQWRFESVATPVLTVVSVDWTISGGR